MRNKRGEMYTRAGRYKGSKYAYALREDRELISVQVPADVHDKIEALAWLLHGSGRLTPIVHMLLTRGVDQMIADLSPKERDLLENRILLNVKINRDIHRKQRRERAKEINREMRLTVHDDETRDFPDFDEDEEEIPAP